MFNSSLESLIPREEISILIPFPFLNWTKICEYMNRRIWHPLFVYVSIERTMEEFFFLMRNTNVSFSEELYPFPMVVRWDNKTSYKDQITPLIHSDSSTNSISPRVFSYFSSILNTYVRLLNEKNSWHSMK
jgi:hypothetical protein